MPTIKIAGGNPRNYGWGAEAQMNRGWLHLLQDQGEPNGLQGVLLNPKQARELVAAYQKQYPRPPKRGG